jgi:hypothetical protein
MSTISDKIKAAALGPAPEHPHWADSWVGWGGELDAVSAFDECARWADIPSDQIRMFLLFVAEAIE